MITSLRNYVFAKMMDILSDDDRPHYYYGRNHFILHKFFLLHGFFNLKKDNLLKTHNFLTDIDDDDIRWFFFFTSTKETQSRYFAIAFVPMKIYLLRSRLHDGKEIPPQN